MVEIEKQLLEIKKLSYEFYQVIADAKDSLGYTAKLNDDREIQVSVTPYNDEGNLKVSVDIEVYSRRLRILKKVDVKFYEYILLRDNKWKNEIQPGHEPV